MENGNAQGGDREKVIKCSRQEEKRYPLGYMVVCVCVCISLSPAAHGVRVDKNVRGLGEYGFPTKINFLFFDSPA